MENKCIERIFGEISLVEILEIVRNKEGWGLLV